MREPISLRWGSHVSALDLDLSSIELDRWAELEEVASVGDPLLDHISHRHIYRDRSLYRLEGAIFEPVSGDVLFRGQPIAEGRSQPVGRKFILGNRNKVRKWNATPVTGLRSLTYYHWMLEELPAAIWARAIEPSVSVAVSKRCGEYAKESLGVLGFPCVFTSRPVSSDDLLLADRGSDFGWPHPYNTSLLKHFLEPVTGASKPNTAVFVSRAGTQRAPKCAAEVEEIAGNLGYRVIRLHEVPWREQLSAFAGARRVVAQHGAGLANLVMCREGTEVIEIMDPNYASPLYEVLSDQLHLAYRRVVAQLDDIKTWRHVLRI